MFKIGIKISHEDKCNDWRLFAIDYLEPHIVYFSRRYQYHDMSFDDYVDELILHLWNKLDKFDPKGKAQLKTWASVVMRNKCIDIYRKRIRKKRVYG